MKKTPWFDGHVKPVRDGVYERLMPTSGTVKFACWCNGRWGFTAKTPGEAVRVSGWASSMQEIDWRGVQK